MFLTCFNIAVLVLLALLITLYMVIGEEFSLVPVKFISVEKYNTVKVVLSKKEVVVRLIGVGKAVDNIKAFDKLNSLVKDSNLYLLYDDSTVDENGNTVAYLWTDNKVIVDNRIDIEKYMVNAVLIKEGYVQFESEYPNSRYDYYFEEY